ncbi:MAG: hypothetical protein QOK11_3728, partial [Pseudonocardiales bacterium]|nr:hypothetical protein [Pseudonocardiales bacterium]
MISDSAARGLATTLVDTLLAADPFIGTNLGLREYDALLPDPSAVAEEKLAQALAGIEAQAAALEVDDPADRVTLGVVRSVAATRRAGLANRFAEYTVSAMPIGGPPALFAIAARTTLPDAAAAGDYLTRLRGAAAWIDGTTERLRTGHAKGRYPVAELVDQAIAWADHALASPVPAAFAAPTPPAGWGGEPRWRAGVEQTVTE